MMPKKDMLNSKKWKKNKFTIYDLLKFTIEDNRKRNPEKPSMNKYQKHIACSFGYKLEFVDKFRGSVHTQTATANVKLMLILKTHPPSLLTSVMAH